MTEQRPERRARLVSFSGLILTVSLSIGLILLWSWTHFEAVRALSLLSLCGLPIWLILLLVYHQRVLVQDEAFETEQLRKEREQAGGSIFDVDKEELMLAKRRLRLMYKWLLPAFTVITITALGVAAQWGFGWSWAGPGETSNWPVFAHARHAIFGLVGAGFLSFLMSRYVVGMSRYSEWTMLHAGATYLMGITLTCVFVAAMIGSMLLMGNEELEVIAARVLRFLLLILSAEFAITFVLDFYRPRSPDEEPHLAFDSRLLGLFTEPGGIARSIAEAINYQFGFEVSSTWMYQLMQRAFVPLIGFALVLLVLASSLVFVQADEVAIVERFGAIQGVTENGDSMSLASSNLLEPGLHIKWPWPIDRVRKVSVGRLHSIRLGIAPEDAAADKEPDLFLWTNRHPSEPHLEVLIATPSLTQFLPETTGGESMNPIGTEGTALETIGVASSDKSRLAPRTAVPVSQLRISVTLQYMIRDPYQWLYNHAKPELMLEAIANREVMRYCASVDIEGILGQEQNRIEQELWQAVSNRVAAENLGIEVVFLGILGVHPPADTAESFQKVTGAEQEAQAVINSANSDYEKTLAAIAGDKVLAENLARSIRSFNVSEQNANTSDDDRALVRKRIDRLFFGDATSGTKGVGGEAAGIMIQGRADRWKHENQAHAQHVRFLQEMKVKNAAPTVYRTRKYMNALADSLTGIRKYVVAAKDVKVNDMVLDLRRPLTRQLQAERNKDE